MSQECHFLFTDKKGKDIREHKILSRQKLTTVLLAREVQYVFVQQVAQSKFVFTSINFILKEVF